MADRLILTEIENKMFAYYYERKELVKIDVVREQQEYSVGSIYTARVKNIIPNINAAFVNIGDEMCYYSLEDNRHTIWLNHNHGKTLKCGDEILVQIAREAVKTKQPGASCYLQFHGKYCVLTYAKTGVGISKKIISAEKREQLQKMYQEVIKDYHIQNEFGVIVRTAAALQEGEELRRDVIQVIEQACYIMKMSLAMPSCKCLYMKKDCYTSLFEALNDSKSTEIITDSEKVYDILMEKKQQSCFNGNITFYDKEIPLSVLYELKASLAKSLAKEVWLSSGAYLVIEPCEALTVIDVNTGKSIAGRQNKEEHILRINLEAAEMVARQLRIRNYSGIIIVDFIDMKSKQDNQMLLNTLQSYLEKDDVKSRVVDMTSLGLVEITRKKVKKPLHEQIK